MKKSQKKTDKQRQTREEQTTLYKDWRVLLDKEHKLLYAGEARDLIGRLTQPHSSIPHWDYFRYSVLPDHLAEFRLSLERMLIRDLAAMIPNKKGVGCIPITDYKLANDKIDK